ncbi:NAD(P)H-dependent flavin oxidoreductase [Chloroflexota bacterium]
MFKTRLTELLGIEYPIIQGAMMWLSRAELASAVSNAGGLGIIDALSSPTAEDFRQEIRKMRNLTDKPFAVNITLMPIRRPINREEYINVALEEGINIIETSGRSPAQYMDWFKTAKVKVLHKVAKVKNAKTAERLGADAVTIVGYEAGGHPGMEDVTSLVLVPKAADILKIPVIAGGGFSDARGLVAALALGAEGVLMGTRFMTSQECSLHPKIKELLLQTRETGTMMIERSIKNGARVIKTDFASKVLEMEEKGATLDELVPMISGVRIKKAYTSGDINDSIFYCGQGIGSIDRILSVKEIFDHIINEAKLIGQRLNKMGISV